MKHRFLLLGIAALAIALAQPLGAATATGNLTVNAAVSASAKLTIGSAAINFPNSDPDTVTSIDATENPVSVTAKGKTSAAGSITLTLLAADDLKSGTDVITLDNVTWTGSGTGFVGGTMSKAAAQSVASWTGSGDRSGSVSFKLANSWSYVTGSYSASSTFTLTAP